SSTEGMDPSDYMFQVASQENLGAIEPQTGAGTRLGGGNMEAFTPIDERIDHLARRATAWLRLTQKTNADKRVVIIYYDRELGKNELMRGTATGMFLNSPRSLVKLLQRMKAEGYNISPCPTDENELIRWMMDRGRQVGVWAPEELDRLVRQGRPVLVSTTNYISWLNARVPGAAIKDLEAKWGAAPGKFMTWEDDQKQQNIVIPRIELGNIILLPQPLRGEAHDQSLVHDRRIPPPHNYLATYFWIEQGFHADAVIHFGTHGSELCLPGKTVGLCDKDWSDIVLGSLPNINPWIINNLGESLPVKRRAYAVTISHLTPPLVTAGISDDLLNLQGDLEKWDTVEKGALKEKFRRLITDQVLGSKLNKDLQFVLSGGRLLNDEEINRVGVYLHQIQNEITPVSLHVLGEPPGQDTLIPYLVTCLHRKFLDNLGEVIAVSPEDNKSCGDKYTYLRKKAEEVLRLVVCKQFSSINAVLAIGGKVTNGVLPVELEKKLRLAVDLNARFQKTGQELDNILGALNGRFIPPGPGNDPTRNAGAVPTGRNLYVLNPEEVPSQPSWELGKLLTDQMLQDHLAKHGHYPQKVAFDLSSFATFADYGVMESQIFYLIGVEPVWDEKNTVPDVKVIPRDVLKRPRIDVFISSLSYYRDNLPSRMVLIDKAIRKVSELDEPDNGVRSNSQEIEKRLLQRKVSKEKAATLARARIFGYPPGQYGDFNYYYLVQRSGHWDTREQLIKMYLAQVNNVYTEGMWGESTPEAYEESIQGTEVVIKTWADPVRSPLADKYTWWLGGSLSLAVKHLTGKEPDFIFSDVRDLDKARMLTAEDALNQEFRVRLFNRKWIEGMMKEGYAGADQVSVHVSNMLGWKIMRENSISQENWQEVVNIYLHDSKNLHVREWFDKENPYAFQGMTQILLETIRKGYWKPDEVTIREIATAHAESVIRYGKSNGLRGGGNVPFQDFIQSVLNVPDDPKAQALLAEYKAKQNTAGSTPAEKMSPAPVAAPGKNETAERNTQNPQVTTKTVVPPEASMKQVSGKKLEPVTPPDRKCAALWLVAGSVFLALLIFGFVRRKGSV
ncbi:MAG: cobalamin biosynthesis protein CobN, partial [Lentisphaerae bacterium RIFOXYA12_FULL_48_11]